MDQQEIKQEIRRLLDERNAIMLAHNYQRDEIQEVADITGDSLGLARAGADTGKDVIIFCGVHFMAESSAILSPEKKVILPRLDAGCPMADMVTAEGLREMKKKHPKAMVVTYVNSSAAVKAESDICCTSANAIKVASSVEADELILVPDRNLGRWIEAHTDKTCHHWTGWCPTHDRLKTEELAQARKDHPDAVVMAHPECRPDILEMADEILSTSGMIDFAGKSSATRFIVATEMGLLYRLRKENPGKEFILPSRSLICPNMKLTSLEDVLVSLQTLEPQVTVAPDTAAKAKSALDRMLAIPRD